MRKLPTELFYKNYCLTIKFNTLVKITPSASSRKSIPIYACYFSPAFPRLTDGQIGQG